MADSERVVFDAGSPAEWERWLEVNHDTAAEVWLRLFNKSAGEVPLSYGEAVEIALCFGWIDSLARGHDDVTFTISAQYYSVFPLADRAERMGRAYLKREVHDPECATSSRRATRSGASARDSTTRTCRPTTATTSSW